MIALLGGIGVTLTVVFFVMVCIQGIRKRPWGVCFALMCVGMVLTLAAVAMTPDESTTEGTAESESSTEEVIEPAVFTAEELYGAGTEYLGQEVTVSGTIAEISEFEDMNGYYLYGTKGQGLVVWIYETEMSHEAGEEVTLTGTVENAGDGQVEVVVNAPETEVSADAELVLMQIAEDVAAQIAQNPSTVSFSTFEWGFAREGNTYAVQGTFTCSNAFGVSENHVLQVWCETNEDQSKITPYRVVLDGNDLKMNN